MQRVVDGINFVSANGIFAPIGVIGDVFSPKMTLSIEESIILFNRINLEILSGS